MSHKTASRLKSKSVQPTEFRLNKVTSLMLASAVLSMTALHAGAQTTTARPTGVVLPTGLSGNFDGQRQTGYLITGDSRFGGAASVTFGVGGERAPQSLVHNFKTTGGAGSGGGAGLGGAFFVDAGASLTVINTDFASNRVQGGSGGSVAPVSYAGRVLNVIGEEVDLNPLPVVDADFVKMNGALIGIQRTVTNGTANYLIDRLSVSSKSEKFLSKDSAVIFNSFDGAGTSISGIQGGVVQFATPVAAKALTIGLSVAPSIVVPITSLVNNSPVTTNLIVGGSTGFKIDNGSLLMNTALIRPQSKRLLQILKYHRKE